MGRAGTVITPLEQNEPTRNRQRFYAITVTRTLFGSWVIVREWGRIRQPGKLRETWFETEGEATAAAFKIVRQKGKRGYVLVSREGSV